MSQSKRFGAYLGLALMLSMVSFVPTPTWASCKNSGGSAAGHKVGSQVSGNTVTICASAAVVSPARKAVVKAPVKTTVKVVAKPVVKVVAKPPFRTILKPTPVAAKLKVPAALKKPIKVIAKPAAKPVIKVVSRVVTKVKPKVTVITKPGPTNTTSGSANFEPAAVIGSVYPSNQLGLGQPATFIASAFTHYRTGTLLALPTEVRFTPVATSWDFGDGAVGAGSSLEYSFDQTGSHQVSVRVVYQVAYRVKGSASWIAEPDTIAVVDELLVQVSSEDPAEPSGEVQPEPKPRRVLLVGADCLTRPGSFGCN